MDYTQIFRIELEQYRQRHGLKRRELANIIGVSAPFMSDFLNGSKGLSIESTLKAIQLLRNYEAKPASTADDYALQNQKALANYAKGKSRIKYFQSTKSN
jgi:transcriptional regulator with XRE-family HTH domain